MESLAFSLAYAIPAFGAAIGVGLIGYSALSAAGRNPEKASTIQQLMILAIAFTDALAIIGIIVAILSKVM
jgi:F-type H+-transporting ATPase subunit c